MSKTSRSHRYSLPLATSLFGLSILCVFALHSRYKLRKYQHQLEKQSQLRQEERKGRISAEKKLRKSSQEVLGTSGFTYQPIGYIESPFPDHRATPRQPILAPAARGFLRFNKKIIQYQHYEELAQFSHIWVIFIFHENTNNNGEKASLPAKIAPPRLGGERVGCLSTRSPHRPNPIGLSVCEIVEITDQYIEIRGIDFVNGTPVLDIKPYIPYDIIPCNYALSMVTAASGSPLPVRSLSVPSWIVDSDIPLVPISFTPTALHSLEEIVQQKSLKFYQSSQDMIEFISQVLRQDIRGVHQGRGKSSSSKASDASDQGYTCRLDNLLLRFCPSSEKEGEVVVEEVHYQSNLSLSSKPSNPADE